MSRCVYTAAAAAIPGDLDDDWRCPRKTVDGGNRCEFHDPEALSEGEAAAEVLDSLSATPEDDPFAVDLDERRFARERKRFVGARLPTLDLSDELIERRDTLPLDLRGARIRAFSCRDARIEADLDLGGSRIETVDATECVVDGDCLLRDTVLGALTLDDARVGGRLVLTDAVVKGDVEATECVVDGRFEFKYGAVEGRLYCPGLTLRGERHHANTSELTLRLTEVRSHVVLEHLRSRGALLLNDLYVGGDLRLDAVDLDDSLWLGGVDDESTTLGPVNVEGNLSVRNGRIGGDADLAEPRDGTLPGPVVGGCLDLSGTAVAGGLNCTPRLRDRTSPVDEEFPVVRLRDVTVDAGSLSQPTASDPVVYDLRNATLGDVRLGTNGGSVDRLHLVETTFDGFVFGRNRDAFEAADWRIHEVSEAIDGSGYRALATASSAADAMALADDLLAAVATFEGFEDDLDADDPVAAVTSLIGDHTDFAAVDRGSESLRESALPDPFDSRESGRVGLVRGLAAANSDSGSTTDSTPDAVVALSDPAVRDVLRRAAPDAYPADDPGSAVVRGDLQSAIAGAIADVDAEVPDAETLVTTYVLARNGANRVGDTNAASRFFRNEMLQRRRVYQAAARAGSPPRERLGAGFDYVSNLLFALSSGYGERPGRVLTFSGGVVLVFAGVFAVLLPDPPYGGLVGYGLLSLESFVALILGGGTEQSDLAVRLAATLEGFVGAFLIALFVFALTRSLER